MAIINVNSISGINSITAQGASGIEFFDSSGSSVQKVTGDGLTVGTGATISGSTNTITASTNGEERVRITSNGNVGINNANPSDALTVYKTNIGNPSGITIRNTEASSTYSHARLRLESQNGAAYGQIWADVANAGLRLGYNSASTVKIDTNGNIVLLNGRGIDFSATGNSSGTMSSELLDDYEEGSFTPVWGDGSSAYSSPAPTYSTQRGDYTKIGNVVYYDIHLITTALNGAGSTMWVYGLPFTTRTSGYQQGGGGIFCVTGVDSANAISNLTTQIASNTTRVELYYQTASTGANYNVFSTNEVNETGTVTIRINGFYFV